MTTVPAVDPRSLPVDLVPLGADPFYGVLGARPDILRAWHDLDKVFFGPTSELPNALKEEARRALAQGVGCRFCASLGEPRPEHLDRREALAVAFAELVRDHREVDDAQLAVLREEFTDSELVELVSWVCFKLGSNLFGALMRLEPATEQQVAGYADFVASGAPA